MSPTPSGRLVRTPAGRDLVLTRTFRAPIDDVWASITESDRTARWFGSWTGGPGQGSTVFVKMTFEADGPPQEMRIDACEAPRHLALSSESEYGSMRIEAHLTETAGVTELRFTHHLDDGANVGDYGPGWEYYLDLLAASREGTPNPDFNDYYPSQKPYFLEQDAQLAPV